MWRNWELQSGEKIHTKIGITDGLTYVHYNPDLCTFTVKLTINWTKYVICHNQFIAAFGCDEAYWSAGSTSTFEYIYFYDSWKKTGRDKYFATRHLKKNEQWIFQCVFTFLYMFFILLILIPELPHGVSHYRYEIQSFLLLSCVILALY